MKQIKFINLEDVSDEVAGKYDFRESARAVVVDENNLVAIIYSNKRKFCSLPGGGLEENEDHGTAMKREIKEEIGCDVEIIKEIGFTTEYRKPSKLRQIAYCYLTKVVGEKGEPSLTEDEIEDGYQTLWMPIDEAIKKIQDTDVDIYWWPYVKIREVSFLEAVKNHF